MSTPNLLAAQTPATLDATLTEVRA